MTPNMGPTASDTIDAYRKRQQRGPFLVWGAAVVLLIIAIIVLVIWLTGDSKPKLNFLSTETPTPTLTPTVTASSTPTLTPTFTLTPTVTLTPTPSAPFSYIVQENESLALIAEKFELGDDGILLLLALNPIVEERTFVLVGEEILIPNPGMKLPTATPVPVSLPRGTLLAYTIRPGDTLDGIAEKFRSTVDAIRDENDIENDNAIQVGQVLQIPANLVTPVPTRLAPTAPANVTLTPTEAAQAEKTPIGATCAYEENEVFVAQIFELVNTERTNRGLPALVENPQLTAAAEVHARDMACNSFYKAEGSDGSTVEQRIKAQGYTASLALQEIHAQPPEYQGDGQAAYNAWMMSGGSLMNPTVTEVGIAYAYSANSSFGGYFTIILAAP